MGPLSTAVIVSSLTLEGQGHYYLMSTLAVVVAILQFGDVEASLAYVDKSRSGTFLTAVRGLGIWRLTAMLFVALLAGVLATFASMLGTTSASRLMGFSYLVLVAGNAVIAIPHHLSQAL